MAAQSWMYSPSAYCTRRTPGLEALPHFESMPHVAVVFRVSVYFAALLNGFDQRHCLRHGFTGKHFAEHVAAAFQQAYRKGACSLA